jgi:protein TonB
MIKKNDQDEGCLVSSGSDDDSFTVSCYLPNLPEEPDEGDPSDENYVHKTVDELPEFPGGEDKMKEYIHKRIKYPKAALEDGISGRVVLSVIVEKDGSLSGLEILRAIDPDLDKEAIRIIKGMPKWKPGKYQGEVVRVQYTIPIGFRLPY